MTAPDELRQLADALDDRHAKFNDWCDGCGMAWPCVEARAAVALRHHANLIDAIGDPDELRWHRWHCEATGSGDDLRELLVRIADAVDAPPIIPPPAPTTCPECGSDDPKVRRYVRVNRLGAPCPDSWHQESTLR
jgi:hypothetical protein